MTKLLTVRNALIGLGVALLLGVISGLSLGWSLWVRKVTTQTIQTPEPAQRNPGGSFRVEKTPTSTPDPKQMIQRGAKVLSTLHGVVRPRSQSSAATHQTHGISATALPQTPSSEPSDVRIDTTIYETKDGQTHAVMSSPDGTVVSGNYSPVVKRVKLSELKNAIGLVGGLSTKPSRSFGVFYDRDFAWARIGGEVLQETYLNTGQKEYIVNIKGGIRF